MNRNLALLYVVRWAGYRRSQHVQSKSERWQEFDRLVRNKTLWAKEGRMPIPSDEGPDMCHVLRQAIGSMEDLDASPQEAWLTVEVAGRIAGFEHWGYLATHARQPWSWWRSAEGRKMSAAKMETLGLLVLLARELDRFKP